MSPLWALPSSASYLLWVATITALLSYASLTAQAAPPLRSVHSDKTLKGWFKRTLKSRDPWARFGARARALTWPEALTDKQQTALISTGQERGVFLDLKRWLQVAHALRVSDPELSSYTEALGFLKRPLISAQALDPEGPLKRGDWAPLPAQLSEEGLYPVSPWGETGYYALWRLHSLSARTLRICLTSEAKLHVWMNGEPLGAIEGASSLWLDQRCWRVPFSQGLNQLVVHATGAGLWGVRLTARSGLAARLPQSAHKDDWGRPQRGLSARATLQDNGLWREVVRLVDQATERGTRGHTLLSDEGLLGVGLYASLASVPEAQRLSPVIEAHLRWERDPTLTMIEALEALTPRELRAQSWGDYPPPREPLQGGAGRRALRLWLSNARDHIREGRFSEARRSLAVARSLYPQEGSLALDESQLLIELGLNHSAYQLSSEAYLKASLDLEPSARGALGRQLARLRWANGDQLGALELLQALSGSASGGERRALLTWLELSLELSEEALSSLGRGEGLKLKSLALQRAAHGPFSWSTPLLAAELALAQGRWTEALKWLSSPSLRGLPIQAALTAEVHAALGDKLSAERALVQALQSAPGLERALSLARRLQGAPGAHERSYTAQLEAERPLGPPLERLIEDAPWRSLEGDRDPPPVRVLYDHTDLELDDEGRLIRRQRVALEVLKPEAAEPWRVTRVPHRPALEELKLGPLVHLRRGEVEPLQVRVTQEGLSDPEARVYYDAQVEVIDFGALQRGDILSWEWRATERQPDREGVRVHGALIPLQGAAPIALKTLSLGPRAQRAFQLVYEPRSLWIERGPSALIARGVPARSRELSAPSGASAMSYAHVSVLRSWSAVRALYQATLEPNLSPSPQLATLAARWTRGLTSVEDQVRALYLEVTRRVRYVGLEFGRHSFTPAPPLETLSRGFGDCKDRAALMIALAQTLGVELQFAMVRTASAGRLELEGAASLGAFNHAALYSPSLGRFLDPTVAHHDPWVLPSEDQGGQALIVPLSPSAQALEPGAPDITLSLIPYQRPSLHKRSLKIERTEGRLKLTWERRGSAAAEARVSLEGSQGEGAAAQQALRSWAEDQLRSWLPNHKPQSLMVTGLSPAVDPLVIEAETSGEPLDEPLELTRVIESWRLMSELSPSGSRRSPWRQLPVAYELCVPKELSASSPSSALPPVNPHAKLTLSTQGALSCALLEFQGGELSPQAYLRRRAWIIEASRALSSWLTPQVERR